MRGSRGSPAGRLGPVDIEVGGAGIQSKNTMGPFVYRSVNQMEACRSCACDLKSVIEQQNDPREVRPEDISTI